MQTSSLTFKASERPRIDETKLHTVKIDDIRKLSNIFTQRTRVNPIAELDTSAKKKMSKVSTTASVSSIESSALEKFVRTEFSDLREEDFNTFIIVERAPTVLSRADWLAVLKTPNAKSVLSESLLFNSLRCGIPSDLRPHIWKLLANVNEARSRSTPGYYESLRDSPSAETDRIIQKDVDRTFRTEPFFSRDTTHRALTNILRAYAAYDKDIGYTQGMNYVAALLLYTYGNTTSTSPRGEVTLEQEEAAFWTLVFINYERNWRGVYTDRMPKLFSLIQTFEKRLVREVKGVVELMKEHKLNVIDCFGHHFISLMASTLPFQFSARIMDVFLFSGEKILFDVLVRLVQISRDEILDQPDTECLFNFLKREMVQRSFEKYTSKLNFLIPCAQTETLRRKD